MRSKGIALCASFAAFIALSLIGISTVNAQSIGDCVRTVRSISDFEIRGDAWTWWNTAAGQYDRDQSPALGSVLVFKRSPRLNRGHVSLVSQIIDRRTIEVDHSWLDGRGLRRNMRVVDVSPRNDWSAVRVWHEPSDQLGMRVYTTYGFILPEGEKADEGMSNAAGIGSGFSVAPQGRSTPKPAGRARLMEASLKGHTVVIPGRKPQVLTASLTLSTGKNAAARMPEPVVVGAVLPARKPTLPASQKAVSAVASTEGVRAVLPSRKPVVGDGAVAELAAR